MSDYITGDRLSDDDAVHIVQDINNEDPISFAEAIKEEKWRKAMDSEIASIEKNETWSLVELPKNAKRIGVNWVFKTKRDESGHITKHKARLVAKDYSKKQGVDFSEVFAPVARLDTVRMVIAMAAQKGWKIHQLDVKSAFLHGRLHEQVYVEQPQGYEKEGAEHLVYRLHKALYGLKQAPRAWFSRIKAHFVHEAFQSCDSEQTLFTKRTSEGKLIIVSVYVDDLIFTGNDEALMMEFKASMLREFDMSDLGHMSYFLGIEVLQREDGNFICQHRYAEEVLKRFGMFESNSSNTPIVPQMKIDKDVDGALIDETHYKQLVGSLMYLTSTRPDIMFVTSLLSRYMSKPTETHLQEAKRVLRYLKGTLGVGIFYQRNCQEQDLMAYTDSDYAGDVDDRKSTSGYVFLLSSRAVAWSAKKQPIVTLSTTEAEFIAAAVCACQAVWMKRILGDIGYEGAAGTNILCDNSSTIKLSKNPVMHGRSKHIDVRYHFLRGLAEEGEIALSYCPSGEQVVDIMTKALKVDTYLKLRTSLGMIDISELI